MSVLTGNFTGRPVQECLHGGYRSTNNKVNLDFQLFHSLVMGVQVVQFQCVFYRIDDLDFFAYAIHKMAKGTPGKPPPVPTSKILLPVLNERNFPIDRECST